MPIWAVLLGIGIFSGVLAGFLGIGGGTVLVPMLLALEATPVQAVATSSLAILITASAGTIQNWRMGQLSIRRVLAIGFPALLTAQIGVYLANLSKSVPHVLLIAFGCLLLINIYLVDLKKQITKAAEGDALPNPTQTTPPQNAIQAQVATGSLAGLLAGVFGIGGGVIMVPMQMLLLHEPIKTAIQTSLGVIVITAISACVGHATSGNILPLQGFLLGLGGLLGVQVSTRLLPKLPERIVSVMFRSFLTLLSVYIFYKAYLEWQQLPPA